MVDNFKKQRSSNTEVKQAFELQTFLRQIKFVQKHGFTEDGKVNIPQGEAFPFSKFWAKSQQQGLMEELNRAHPQLFNKQLFLAQSNISYILGGLLESGVRQVLTSLEFMATGGNTSYEEIKAKHRGKDDETKKINEKYLSESLAMGGFHVQVPDLNEAADDIMKSAFNQMYVTMQEKMIEHNPSQQKEMSKLADHMVSVQGKIDIAGYRAELDVKGNTTLSPYAKRMVKALTGATFTAKNYISSSSLHFGNTNPFRIFATVAPSGEDTVGRFKQMLNCFDGHAGFHTKAPTYFYRIKAIYELTGYGTQYVRNVFNESFQGSGARFLIYNDPVGEIYVIPTQSIMDQLLNDSIFENKAVDAKTALFGNVSIPRTSITAVANNLYSNFLT